MADGTLIVQEYTGDGFAPVIIEPEPLEDVSAINFLGAQIAKKHPLVRDWVVAPPSAVDLEPMITRRGKYRPMRELAYGDSYPILEGYRDSVALGWHVRFEDPAQFHKLDISASYSPDHDLPARGTAARRLALRDARLALGVLAQRRGLLRPVRADQAQPQGRCLHRRLRQGADLRRPAPARSVDRGGVLHRPRYPAGQPERAVRVRARSSPAGPRSPTATRAARRDRWTTKKATAGKSSRISTAPAATTCPSCAAASISASRCRSAIRRYGCTTPPASPSGNRDNSLASFYFGGFGNNYVDDGEIKRYRDYDSFPGVEIDELAGAQLRQERAGAEPAAAAFRGSRVAGILPRLGAPRALCRRAGRQARRRLGNAHRLRCRRAGGPAVHRAQSPGHDPVARLRGRIRGRPKGSTTSGCCRSRSSRWRAA